MRLHCREKPDRPSMKLEPMIFDGTDAMPPWHKWKYSFDPMVGSKNIEVKQKFFCLLYQLKGEPLRHADSLARGE